MSCSDFFRVEPQWVLSSWLRMATCLSHPDLGEYHLSQMGQTTPSSRCHQLHINLRKDSAGATTVPRSLEPSAWPPYDYSSRAHGA